MKNFIFAFFIVLFLVCILILVLSLLEIPVGTSQGLIGSFVLVVLYVHRLLEKKDIAKTNSVPLSDRLVQFKGFGMASTVMIFYGTLILLAVASFNGFLFGLALGPEEEMVTIISICIIIVFLLAGNFFIGHWVGSRCSEGIAKGMVTLLAIYVTYGLLKLLIDIAFIDSIFSLSKIPSLSEAPHERRQSFLIMANFMGIVVYFIIGLIGYWFGRRRRLSKYMDYLMHILSPDTRKILVELAYDEVKRLVSDRVATSVKNQVTSKNRRTSER